MSVQDHSHDVWEEKYRANTLFRSGKDENGKPLIPFILPDTPEFNNLVAMAKGEMPLDHLLFYSEESGTGKTTLLHALKKDLELEGKYFNISSCGGIDTIRGVIEGYVETKSRNGKVKLVQLDEADGASMPFQKACRALMDNAVGSSRFVFTCNYADSLINAIHSRCLKFDMSMVKHKESLLPKLVSRVMGILKVEGVEYDKEAVHTLVDSHYPDMRRVLKALQHISQAYGKIDEYGVKNYDDGDITGLTDAVFALSIKGAMEWYRTKGIDPNRLYRPLFRQFPYMVPPNDRAEAMYLIEEYTDKASRTIDREVTFCTLIVRMVDFVKDLKKGEKR